MLGLLNHAKHYASTIDDSLPIELRRCKNVKLLGNLKI